MPRATDATAWARRYLLARVRGDVAALRRLSARRPGPQPPGFWRTAAPLGTARADAAGTVLANGRVLVAGGDDFLTQPFASAELYDPATGSWSLAASMSQARASPG